MNKVSEIQERLERFAPYKNIYVPEFTFQTRGREYRIDAIIIDIPHRWIRGFEIKVKKVDFQRDTKWTQYTRFCSSVSIACPEGLIEPEEVKSPFGLLWIGGALQWKKRPLNFQKRDSLAWIWTYIEVLEYELPRLNSDLCLLKDRLKELNYVKT